MYHELFGLKILVIRSLCIVSDGSPVVLIGGESIYGGTFEDEFHSRLRFNHRGLVACANAGSSHTNGSQFFLSLDRCDWLDRKNAIFGKVVYGLYFDFILVVPVFGDLLIMLPAGYWRLYIQSPKDGRCRH